ncbi:MAG: DUF4375 domain-containing protein [Lachnospiraceae bacterium]|nr:DUF4375 domain-containing protein [Lachnospiraceae bacterium]
MSIKLIQKHFDFHEKEIAAGKYNPWELIQPLWYTVSIYDGFDVYERDLKPFSDALECMRMIGAEKYADNFQKAVDMFGGSVPFDRADRIAALDKLCENEEFDNFHQIDKFYYGEECINQLMDDYVKRHASEFVVKGDYPYAEF